MILRSLRVVLCLAALSMFTACPTPVTTPDANDVPAFDAGNPPPRDACSGGCAANQLCDTARRTCVDACGGCDAGTCVKVGEGMYQCATNSVQCSGNVCELGQVACLGGGCTCLSSLSGALDTCEAAGKWCNGRTCATPKALQQCRPGDDSAKCPTGYLCQPVFGDDLNICTKECADDTVCGRGEFCSGVGCLPAGLFSGQECNQNEKTADGGIGPNRITVPVSNTCLLKDNAGTVTEAAGKGTGNCTYAVFQFWDDGIYPFTTCRPPGGASEGQPCRDDYAGTAQGTQCNTGLQCVKTRGGDDGVCMRMCNAQPPSFGFPSTPACNADESCVNVLRYQDPNSNAVLGACMKNCDIFDGTKSTCANVGTNVASCVPTEASGELVVTPSGSGICIPQRPTIAAVNTPCAETDSFRGAACASAQLCASFNSEAPATCTATCDLECSPSDGGTGPARCAIEPNAKCSVGTCRRVTSTSGSRVGFCLQSSP